MITAPELEIAVLVLGMAILLVEAFATKIDKRVLGIRGNCRSRAGSRGELLRSPQCVHESSNWLLEFLHCRPTCRSSSSNSRC